MGVLVIDGHDLVFHDQVAIGITDIDGLVDQRTLGGGCHHNIVCDRAEHVVVLIENNLNLDVLTDFDVVVELVWLGLDLNGNNEHPTTATNP